MASRLETYALSVITEPERRGLVPGLLRGFLGVCAGLYDAGLELYLLSERAGLRRRTRLPLPVVSVGNLSVGGTGKTPMTQWLCRRLTAEGARVAVLSRGHGGTGTGVRVVSDTDGVSLAAEAGDEPALLVRTLPGVPLLTGKDRRLSGREALRRFALDALVLDDGFQYWQLARDLDIVLLDARRPFENGFPLPRGLLREPKRHLSRAGAVVVTRADALDEAARAALRAQIAFLAPTAPVFFARHRPAGLVPVGDDASASPRPVSWLRGRRVVALCGIAQPRSFGETLAAAGADVRRSLVYGDHAAYTDQDARRAAAALRESGSEALVMTEKDAVKWPVLHEAGAAYALRVEMQVENEQELMVAVRKCLAGKWRG